MRWPGIELSRARADRLAGVWTLGLELVESGPKSLRTINERNKVVGICPGPNVVVLEHILQSIRGRLHHPRASPPSNIFRRYIVSRTGISAVGQRDNIDIDCDMTLVQLPGIVSKYMYKKPDGAWLPTNN